MLSEHDPLKQGLKLERIKEAGSVGEFENTTKKMLITVAEYKMSVDEIEEWIRRHTAEL